MPIVKLKVPATAKTLSPLSTDTLMSLVYPLSDSSISKSMISDCRATPNRASSTLSLGVPPARTSTLPEAWITAPPLMAAVMVLLRSLMTKAPINWPIDVESVCTPATAPAATILWLDKAATDTSLTRVMLPPTMVASVEPSRSTTDTVAPTPAEPLPVDKDNAPPPAPTRLRS